jgi:PTH2 family peptidyl-tRNA hydrolase
MEGELRMYILVRRDLKMGPGKVAGQCGHAVQYLILKGQRDIIERYNNSISPKIILKIENLDHLEQIEKICLSMGLPVARVIDAGRTQIPENTVTVLGVGPCLEKDIPSEIKSLKLY